MNRMRLALRSARYYLAINLAVGLGVAAATAVLTGALLVGDSMQGSLRDLSLDRLGEVTHVVLADRFFAVEHADNLATGDQKAAPMILLRGSVDHPGAERLRLAGGVSIFGVSDAFWQMNPKATPPKFDGDNSIILNEPLAAELKVAVGDEVAIRLPSSNDVPADSPLGKKTGRVKGIPRLKVAAIIPASGLGRFGLFPNQQAPLNAFVPLPLLQDSLDQPNKANAILLAASDPNRSAEDLAAELTLSLDDFGYRLDEVRQEFAADGKDPQTIFDYLQFSSSRMIFSAAAEEEILNGTAPESFPVFTYLATTIKKEGAPESKEIPYSTVTALDPEQLAYPLLNEDGDRIGAIGADEIVLNSWAAEQMEATVDDQIEITYFEPESSHGVAKETTRKFIVVAVTPLTEPDRPASRRRPAQFEMSPTTANDPQLTPEVEGITDQDSIDDWDPPFPFDNRRIRGVDDEYWENYRTTPKAFVSLEAGKELWGSRFGAATSIRVPANKVDREKMVADVTTALNKRKEDLGFRFLLARQNALRAASGTTPFNGLFIGFSMFIIAAALMLVSLLFQLGVDQRAKQIGLESALGLRMKAIRSMLLIEATIVATLGGLVGVALGIGYAWVMLYGLRTWWVAAVVTPFLQLHLDNPATLVIGLVSGVMTSLAAILWGLWKLRKSSPRALLAGQTASARDLQPGAGRWMIYVGIGLIVAAAGLAGLATTLAGEAQAGAFFGAGAAMLAALMLLERRYLLWRATERSAGHGFQLSELALSNAARNPGRSTLTIGLVGAASFLIVAISSFRLAPTDSGAGGMDLIAESSQPIFHDLNSPSGRYDQGFHEEDESLLAKSTILALRVQPGDDASCLNLYQSNSPRVLGATPQFVEHYSQEGVTSFEWAGSAATTPEDTANPWLALEKPADGEDTPIPCALDKNTAMYALHLYGGVGEIFETTDPDGRITKYQVAGLLSNSILQGSLIVSEANLLDRFPDTSGYRMFLVETPPGETDEVASILEDRLSEEGFDATDAKVRLVDLLAVQNTYLSTFQSLGALGLLLGTFGLATVQARNVIERRGELALLQAAGFRRHRLVRLVLLENAVLLIAGLGTGIVAALVAVLPHMLFGAAGVPWLTLATMLGIIFVVGLIAGLWTARASLRTPLIPALRGE
ncbi:FtsX-like permease family protein [Blastopirellula sp. JC732]|uniref:FtsX-like permease family protein n=1 Tax=Blastopirellula sediminis TaxID=2894196 RepID=A0A9X1SI66_9BACT|nr:ABC transporter permease [Blastopirellula sediminis]MCC9605472.1 FtsX-like permease family protein [Blastopirellula sediminis]MCC9631228.1 FtsX-like permease family protein [Blastopirellula sediminis]